MQLVTLIMPEYDVELLERTNVSLTPIVALTQTTKFISVNDAGFIGIKGVLNDWIRQGIEESTREEIHGRSNNATFATILTFNNGLIKTDVVQQGTGNAGRDINYGNVTNQSAERDWINRG